MLTMETIRTELTQLNMDIIDADMKAEQALMDALETEGQLIATIDDSLLVTLFKVRDLWRTAAYREGYAVGLRNGTERVTEALETLEA